MNYKKLFAALVVFGLSTTAFSAPKADQPVFSAVSSSRATADRRIEALTAQTEALQKQVKALTRSMNKMKQQKQIKPSAAKKRSKKMTAAEAARHRQFHIEKPVYLAEHNGALQEEIKRFDRHFPTVITSPHLGLRTAFDASDLIVNMPTMNEDLRLLRNRYRYETEIEGNPLYFTRPVIEFSGKVQGLGTYSRTYGGVSISDVNVENARLDTLVQASEWAMAFMSLTFDPTFLDPALSGVGSRVRNSRLFLERGFVTIGDLQKSPFYFSVGQMYIDFGRYASMMVSAPMTLVLGRTNTRAVNLGYFDHHTGLYTSAYGYRGDSNTGNPNSINAGGANVGFEKKYGELATNIGFGWNSNIANSQGFQGTGNGPGTFQGFGQTPNTEVLVCKVPAIDAHGEFGYKAWSFMAEYVGVTRPFNPADMSFNFQGPAGTTPKGARPQAMHLELNYHFKFFNDKPTAIGLAFDNSWQALALNIPKRSFTFVMTTSLWKETTQTIEYRHGVNYNAKDVATGRCSVAGAITSCPAPVTGRERNTILFELGVYF